MKRHLPIEGSEHRILKSSHQVAAPTEISSRRLDEKTLRVSVWIRSHPKRNWRSVAEEALSGDLETSGAASRRRLASAMGASSTDIKVVKAFAGQHGLKVVDVNPDACRVSLEGDPDAMERAFHIRLGHFRFRDDIHRAHLGPIQVPEDLVAVVEYVSGLDNLPLFRGHSSDAGGMKLRRGSASSSGGRAKYLPRELAALYRFPTPSLGSCETIGILIPSGGFFNEDMEAYFGGLGLVVPEIKVVGQNRPADRTAVRRAILGEIPRTTEIAETLEATMDIQLVGAFYNGARIVVYFGERFDVHGVLRLLASVAAEADHGPRVLSASWGVAESALPPAVLTLLDKQLLRMAANGITLCCSSGDGGSTSLPSSPDLVTTYPASSAYVLACGGTRVESRGSRIVNESVWNSGGNASGGGASRVFPLPDWQLKAGVGGKLDRPGRGVPDVSANAAKETGCKLRVGGTDFVSSGTSAAAPVWAALIALLNGELGLSLGYFNPLLYRPEIAGCLWDIEEGHNHVKDGNGPYRAGKGWDACTGWGSPRGVTLLEALKSAYDAKAGQRKPISTKG